MPRRPTAPLGEGVQGFEIPADIRDLLGSGPTFEPLLGRDSLIDALIVLGVQQLYR